MYTYNLKDGRWFARRKLKLFQRCSKKMRYCEHTYSIILLDVLKETKLYQTPPLPSKNKLLKHTKQIKLFHLKKSDKDSV